LRCQGYLGMPPLVNSQKNGKPSLSKYAKAQDGIILSILLDIPESILDSRASRLVVDGLRLKLQTLSSEAEENRAKSSIPRLASNAKKLPTINIFDAIKASSGRIEEDTNPFTSGPHNLDVLSDGSFVSIKGQETVEFSKPFWEIAWEEDSLTGEFICGLYLQEEARRNDAVLNAGEIYFTFPCWTQESLIEFQDRSDKYNKALDTYYRDSFEELQKMEKTKNPITKLVSFVRSVDRLDEIKKKKREFFSTVPTVQTAGSMLLAVGDNLLFSTKGRVWTIDESKKEFTLVGQASLKF
jgi:hypothetical protein